MLSQRNWHKQVPKDLAANLKFRRSLLDDCANKPDHQHAVMEMCEQDFLFWVNSFVWQYNPQKIGEEQGPFISWEVQDRAFEKMFRCILDRKDLVIVKSRELGATWKCLLVFDYLTNFRRRQKFLAISRSAEAVDRPNDADCLFWKLDYIHQHLPMWMGPAWIKRRRFGFRNTRTESMFNGQASTGKAGVGGRATAMFIDEFSQIDEAYEVLHRTADTTGARIFNFTQTGTDNAAFEMSQRVDVERLELHWSEHPEKAKGLYRFDPATNRVHILDKQYEYPKDFRFVKDGTPAGGPYPCLRSPWYDEQCQRRVSPRAIAMDLDINAEGAQSQFYPAVLIGELIRTYCCSPCWRGQLGFDIDTGAALGLVASRGGDLKLWINPDSKGHVPHAPYVIGGDLGWGTGASPSCLCVANAKTGEKVAEWAHRNMAPSDVASFAVALCRFFKDGNGEPARLAWEQTGPGMPFGRRVQELGHGNIYFRAQNTALYSKPVEEPGWTPTAGAKLTLHTEYMHALSRRKYINRSEPALRETLVFRHERGTVVYGKAQSAQDDPSGTGTNHGDLVVADALCVRLINEMGLTREERKSTEIKVGSLAWRRELNAERARKAAEW